MEKCASHFVKKWDFGIGGTGNTKLSLCGNLIGFMSKQTKFWCFTKWISNPGQLDRKLGGEEIREFQDKVKKWVKSGTITYVVFQCELSKKTKRVHLQGYLELAKRCRMTMLKKLDKDMHIEARKGSAVEARDYCMAGPEIDGGRIAETPCVQYGEISRTENVSDRQAALKFLKETGNLKEMAMQFPAAYLQNSNGFGKLAKYYRKPKVEFIEPQVYCFWGTSGAGKSHHAQKFAEQKAREFKGEVADSCGWDGKFMKGYDGQVVMMLNEYHGEIPYRDFLQLTDKWSYKINVKQGDEQQQAKVIIFTSSVHPKEWYNVSTKEVMRRFRNGGTIALQARPEMESMKWKDFEIELGRYAPTAGASPPA